MSLRNILDKTPIQISTAIILVVNFCMVVGWFHLKAEAVASLNGAMVGVMSLFVSTKTANKRVLNEIQAEFDAAAAAAQPTKKVK